MPEFSSFSNHLQSPIWGWGSLFVEKLTMNECGQGERNFGLGLDPQKRCNTPQIHVRVHIFRKMWRIQMQNWCFSILWNENCLNIFPKQVNPARGKWIFLPEQMLLNNTNSNYLVKSFQSRTWQGEHGYQFQTKKGHFWWWHSINTFLQNSPPLSLLPTKGMGFARSLSDRSIFRLHLIADAAFLLRGK